MSLIEMGHRAKAAARRLARCGTKEKNAMLLAISDGLWEERASILAANAEDMERGREKGLSEGLLDRLLLTEERIKGLQEATKEIVALEDPIGGMEQVRRLENGLLVGKKRVPMGVIAIIYEARPNVTVDCALLCLKASSGLILRGGKEAMASNRALTRVMQKALSSFGFEDAVQLIEDPSHETARELMRLNDYVDLLIPRGSGRLIQTVKENASVPVLETGVGNCHVYVDEGADLVMARDIVENAKTQRVGVCNAMESLLVHENEAEEFLPLFAELVQRYGIEVYGDEETRRVLQDAKSATEEHYAKEFLAMACSVKVVKDIDEAIAHITRFGTGHSEVIVTKDLARAERFTEEVDAACVYVNASSRFTDGGALGLGAEMGISTQKLHARGPVGLRELCSEKYVILGQGQVRE